MRRHRLSRLHFLLIVLPLALLAFSARLTWTQERPSPSKTPIQWSNFAAQFVAVPEAKVRFHPAYENLSLPLAPNQGHTPSLVRLRSLDIGYQRLLTRNNALPALWQLAEIGEPQVKANQSIGNAPTEWLTHAVTANKLYYRTPDPGGEVAYYGRRIPWAGRVILGIGEQAKFHPRVTRVLGLIDPRGLCLENRLPRPVDRQVNVHVISRGQLH
jgi:hypothetical protein